MRKFLIIPILLLLTIVSTIQAQTIETRTVNPFKQIDISGNADVIYTQSSELNLKVEANEKEMANILTSSENGILTIKSKGDITHSYKIYINSNNLDKIDISGSSKFKTNNVVATDSLSINISGSSYVSVNAKTRVIDAVINGSSVLYLEGDCSSLYSIIKGASELKAFKLNSKTASVNTSGASSAGVLATQKIQASASGSSSIKFKGDPKEISVEASSSSIITKIIDEETSKKSDEKDSTEINLKNRKFIIINKDKLTASNPTSLNDRRFHHWAGIGLGVNGLLSNGNTVLSSNQKYLELDYGKSIDFQLNLFETNIHLYKNYINLVTGLGFDWHQYEFNNKTKLNPDSSYTYGVIDSTNTFSYKKNRLKTSFIQVPLLLEFNFNKNPKKAFHIALGVIGGYKLGSKTKQIIERSGDIITSVKKDNYNINPFRLDAYASIGYYNFTVFGSYGLTPLFENGKGPELAPFTIGIKLLNF